MKLILEGDVCSLLVSILQSQHILTSLIDRMNKTLGTYRFLYNPLKLISALKLFGFQNPNFNASPHMEVILLAQRARGVNRLVRIGFGGKINLNQLILISLVWFGFMNFFDQI